ncbi:MAG: c-type cytochrome [Chitinophagaceae bacterium]|nr:c-type cytochrome [Chitinophagaceae bacterium]MCW5927363.1 c-type cytochrome [Chitinophagaceae bacterium]
MFIRFFGATLFFLCISFLGCNQNADFSTTRLDSARIHQIIENAPFLSPEEALKAMQVEEGFRVELVAAEPLISTPVAIVFDEKERIWAVEMNGYMPDTLGTGEDVPNGKIVILEDTDGDGKADNRKVFMDSLVLPRAICLIENGILVAEPPRLLFVEIDKDRPGKITVVDEAYNKGGNVEHEANGLIRGLDNWIYSANSAKRYRKKGDQWLIETTHNRGQWGISQDDWGRLFYNNNSQNLLGDYFLPGSGAGNEYQRPVSGYNVRIVEDNRVYPVRPTTGVNRGYKDDVLDTTGRLIDFTAACGPMLYRSDLFGRSYFNNVFVAEPSANLIKRNILHDEGYMVKGRQAYKNREFLTSIDERFRPVNLHTGPDGSIYIVDMYRGIIQHRYYLTEYLKGEIKKRELTQPLNGGRIYRIVPEKSKYKRTGVPEDSEELITLLHSGNAWLRDMARQKLLDNRYIEKEESLRKILNGTDSVAAVYAYWILEGWEKLKEEDILLLLQKQDWKLQMHALAGMASVLNEATEKEWLSRVENIIGTGDTLLMPAALFQLKYFRKNNSTQVDNLLLKTALSYPGQRFIQDAVISNFSGTGTGFYQKILSQADTGSISYKRFSAVVANIHKDEARKNDALLKEKYPAGSTLFSTVCQSCHGSDGGGIALLAPPLNNSDWVTGDSRKLIAIVLKGLTGPVHVNKKLYKAPDISGDMPGVGANTDITNEGLAELLSYIRKNWNNNAGEVKAGEVKAVRDSLAGRELPFTEEELNKW